MKRKGTAGKRSKKATARSKNLPAKQVTAAQARAVRGGGAMMTDVTLNKSKVANKAADGVDAYIRG
jgi:hypothetical protein